MNQLEQFCSSVNRALEALHATVQQRTPLAVATIQHSEPDNGATTSSDDSDARCSAELRHLRFECAQLATDLAQCRAALGTTNDPHIRERVAAVSEKLGALEAFQRDIDADVAAARAGTVEVRDRMTAMIHTSVAFQGAQLTLDTGLREVRDNHQRLLEAFTRTAIDREILATKLDLAERSVTGARSVEEGDSTDSARAHAAAATAAERACRELQRALLDTQGLLEASRAALDAAVTARSIEPSLAFTPEQPSVRCVASHVCPCRSYRTYELRIVHDQSPLLADPRSTCAEPAGDTARISRLEAELFAARTVHDDRRVPGSALTEIRNVVAKLRHYEKLVENFADVALNPPREQTKISSCARSRGTGCASCGRATTNGAVDRCQSCSSVCHAACLHDAPHGFVCTKCS
jgi:hypothetical protein